MNTLPAQLKFIFGIATASAIVSAVTFIKTVWEVWSNSM